MAGERHLDQRGQCAAVGAIVICEQQALRIRGLDRSEEPTENRRIIEIRRRAAAALRRCAATRCHRADSCRRRDQAARSRCRPGRARVVGSALGACRACARKRSRSAKPERRCAARRTHPASAVCIDSESLPTGIEMPSAGQSSMPTARTASYSAASSPRMPDRRHPVRGQLDLAQRRDRRRGEIRDRLADRHAPRRGGIDQRERRALADRHRLAGVAVEIGERDRAIGDRHLPRTRPSGRAHTGRRPCDRRS